MNKVLLIVASGLIVGATVASAFQLASMGSKFENKLTNETPGWLATVAGKIGVLIKDPVHEEITQLGYGCPVEIQQFSSDKSCGGADRGFASPYVIYGVRWNDLPPFRLAENEGTQCKKLLAPHSKACNVAQTVRFATQPECWYCLFKDAKKKAEKQNITGCQKGKGYIRGNLMTRSHFGDLQFLHAMAEAQNVPASITRQKVLDWLEFAWKVSTREISGGTLMKDIAIPSIKEHFGCSGWKVSEIYILGRSKELLPKLNHIAFGSVLHTIQDSFAVGHVLRESEVTEEFCPGTTIRRVPRIIEFHNYGDQDGHKHDLKDARAALVEPRRERWPDAVEATRALYELKDIHATWDVAMPQIECLFDLSPEHRPSSSGADFNRMPK